MNLEIEVPGLRIKLEYTDKQHIDRTVSAVMNYVQGGSFTDVYDVAQQFVKKKKEGPKNYTPHVNGVKDYGNGKLGYKTFYTCSSCGSKGERFPTLDETFVYCHDCNEKLPMMPATESDAHDEDFNYFLAY